MGTPAAPDSIELGKLAHLDIDQRAPVIPHCPDPTVVEQYLRLRVKILQVQEVQTFRTLVVCSPGPKEGKTVTTVNLGVTFGKLPGYRVLVVDADLRRGGLGKWMGAAGYPGFSNLLDGSAQLEDVVLKSDDMPVHFVFRGTSRHQAGELLHSPRLRESLSQMAGHYDLVLLDSAPVTLLMDTQQLARSCDAALLVARAYSTSRKALRQAMDELSGTRIIGTVLNSSARSRIYRRYNNYYGEGK
jgi:capsular exopolysaccharide synthesis family protein